MTTQTTTIQSYLSFRLGEELFASNVQKVLEILELGKITKVPKSPAYMRGVSNLRGTVLPIIDTRLKFGLSKTEETVDTCIMVLNIQMENQSFIIGALVDSVQEVLEISEDSIQQPPSVGTKYKSDFIEGMVKMNDEFIMILNMDMVFSLDELTNLADSSSLI